jgi:hypothetical protein
VNPRRLPDERIRTACRIANPGGGVPRGGRERGADIRHARPALARQQIVLRGRRCVLAAFGAASGLWWSDDPRSAGLFALGSAITSGILLALDPADRSKKSFQIGAQNQHVANYVGDVLTRVDGMPLDEAHAELAEIAGRFEAAKNTAVELRK